MALIKKHRIGYKASAIELADGSFAEQNLSAGADGFAAAAVTVGATAAALAPADPNRVAMLVANGGPAGVYLGGAQVAATGGFPLASGSSLRLETTAAVYAVAATGSADVRTIILTL